MLVIGDLETKEMSLMVCCSVKVQCLISIFQHSLTHLHLPHNVGLQKKSFDGTAFWQNIHINIEQILCHIAICRQSVMLLIPRPIREWRDIIILRTSSVNLPSDIRHLMH